MDSAFFGNVVMALIWDHAAEAHLQQANSIWDLPEVADDNNSVSSGSVSPDLGDMRRHGCPESPGWDGDVELDLEEEEEEDDRESVGAIS